MSEHPTNADIMRRLDSIAERHEQHEDRLTKLEADRAVVHRLLQRVGEVSREVTIIHQILSGVDEVMSNSIRIVGRDLASQMTAAVRGEVSTLREDVRELRQEVRARPCLVEECRHRVRASDQGGG